MKRSKHASIMLRYLLITAGTLLIAGRVAYCTLENTVLHASKWNEKANKELARASSKMIPPERGDILAADGSVLATTMQFYTLRIDFGSEAFRWDAYALALDSMAEAFHAHFPIKGGLQAWRDSLSAPLVRAANPKKKKPRGWRLIKNITYADYQLIRTQFPFFYWLKPSRSGLTKETVMRRANPYGDMAHLSIGVVSEQANGETHGMSGLEYALDSLLYGSPGVYKTVSFNRGIGRWTDVPAVRGYDVVSTIDVHMQDILENALLDRLEYCRAEWGTAVLMEVATGEIKAISNLEEYPLGSGSGHYVEACNRAVQRFEPGSVVKTLSMMIAVEDGLVRDTAQVIPIGASFRAYGQGSPITDSHFNSQLTVAGVLEQSSNIGMAKIITPHYRDPKAWHDRVARLGFLERLGSGIGEERAARYPVVPIGSGGLVTLSRQTYGYATEIPPLHTLSIYNAIANGGRYVRPRLVKALRREGVDSIVPVSYIRDRVCSESTAAIMRSMLTRVVHGAHGTARSLKNPLVTLAGKTGTCYSVDPVTHQYDKARKRLAFCGFFPADQPKYSCVVLVYHPRENAFGAASTSGMVLKNTALSMYSRGMLGSGSDYMAEGAGVASFPTLHNTGSSRAATILEQQFGVKSISMKTPDTAISGSVPGVTGMSLRDAVARLEKSNYNVTFAGSGYVKAQTPPPGTPLTRGATVNLILSE